MSSIRRHNFWEDLPIGELEELPGAILVRDLIIDGWLKLSDNCNIEDINQIEIKDTTLSEQRRGYDKFLVINEGFCRLGVQVKVRESNIPWYWKSIKEPDVLIETYSRFEEDILGWIYTCESYYFVYAIKKEDNKPGWRFAWCFYMQDLKEWFGKQDIDKYDIKDSINPEYTTRNRAVPFKDIPKEIWMSVI